MEGTLKDADRERWGCHGKNLVVEHHENWIIVDSRYKAKSATFVSSSTSQQTNSAWFSTNERPPNVRPIHVAELGTFKAGFPDEAAAEEAAAEQPVAEQPGVREYVIV